MFLKNMLCLKKLVFIWDFFWCRSMSISVLRDDCTKCTHIDFSIKVVYPKYTKYINILNIREINQHKKMNKY